MIDAGVTQKALLALQKLQARVKSLEAEQRDPVAIIGAGCRLPGGVRSPDEFWELLRSERDAIRPVPPSRWSIGRFYDPEACQLGKTVSRAGGYLEDVQEFDADFFGISRREACEMDPQQRLLLETSWEAIESACIAPRSLTDSQTGVFIGVAAGDYANLRISTESKSEIGGYTASSTSASVAAGRVAYFLGLHGPCLSIDTACSSSLASIYLAVNSLRLRDCDAALAGGVNLALSPYSTIALSQMRMLSPSDCCRPFDASADGFVRGEGCTMLLLKRLSDAIAAADPILAVIRGVAMNHDGRSGGLTAPNGPAQEAVIRRALADANYTPEMVDWVETHGTGTQLGDPIEAQALNNVYGKARTFDDPLLITALKSNIGHLEAGAGAASVLKVALALQRGSIPASLHFERPNPLIKWAEMAVRLASSLTAIPGRDRPGLAGISSFGFSGTNLHLILEEPPRMSQPAQSGEGLLTVSAKHDRALASLVNRWMEHLEATDIPLASACRTAALGRNHFDVRVVFAATSSAEMAQSMRQWLKGSLMGTPVSPLLKEAASRYLQSQSVDWNALLPAAPRAPLPTYTFSRQHYWFSEDGSVEFRIDATRLPFLADHQIGESIVVPAAVVLDLVVQAATRWRGNPGSSLRHVAFANPLRLPTGEARIIQISFCSQGESSCTWECSSVLIDHTELHAAGEVRWNEELPIVPFLTSDPHASETGATFYEHRIAKDLAPTAGVLGPAFQWIRQVDFNRSHLDAKISVDDHAFARLTPSVSPSMVAVDAAFQLIAGSGAETRQTQGLYLPFLIEELWPLRPDRVPTCVMVHTGDPAKPHVPDSSDLSSPEARLIDASGNLLVLLRGVVLRRYQPNRVLANMLYRPGWRQLEIANPGHPRGMLAVTYLCGDESKTKNALHGWTSHGTRFSRLSRADEGDLRSGFPKDVVFLASPDSDRNQDQISLFVATIKELSDIGASCRLWVVTTGANIVDGGFHRNAVDHEGSMLWAAARVARLEHPEFNVRLLDLAATDPEPFTTISAAMSSDSAEPELASRGGQWFKPQLTVDNSAQDNFTANPDKTYWITGGFGALGWQTALWLIQRGARNLALSGRNLPPADLVRKIRDLDVDGVRILSVIGDIADKSSASNQLSEIEREMPPVVGVIHAAGVLKDALIVQSSESQRNRVFAPKVQGARNLVSLLEGKSLDFLLFYSSLAVWSPAPGQVAYAAANAYLDALAESTPIAGGRRIVSINTGPWKGAGMVEDSSAAARLAEQAGIGLLEPDSALAAIGAALSGNASRLVIAGINRAKAINHRALAVLLNLEADNVARLKDVANVSTSAVSRDVIRRRIAEALQLPLSTLQEEHSLAEFGVDSLIALELKQRVERGLPKRVPLQDYLSGIVVGELIDRLLVPEITPFVQDPFVDLVSPPPFLFLFPGAVGSVNYLRPVVSQLANAFRVAGMELESDGHSLKSIPELAATCLRSIRRRQPEGPYYLVGHSVGGFLALEIGRQIRSSGGSVGFLGLLDTAVLTRRSHPQTAPDEEARYVARVLHYLYSPQNSVLKNGHENLRPSEELEAVVRELQNQKLLPPAFRPAQIVGRARASFQAMEAYELPLYDANVCLFRASDPFPSDYFGDGSRNAAWGDPQLGWKPFLPRLDVIPVPGNHLTMVQPPNAFELGRHLEQALRRAQKGFLSASQAGMETGL